MTSSWLSSPLELCQVIHPSYLLIKCLYLNELCLLQLNIFKIKADFLYHQFTICIPLLSVLTTNHQNQKSKNCPRFLHFLTSPIASEWLYPACGLSSISLQLTLPISIGNVLVERFLFSCQDQSRPFSKSYSLSNSMPP